MQEIGRILSLSGGLYWVQTEKEVIPCHAKGTFRKEGLSPVAGDMVSVRREEKEAEDGDKLSARGLIEEILPRKNVLIRPPLANLDTLFLVSSVKDPVPVLLSLDKMLSIARHNGIQAVLVFTKKELNPQGAEDLVQLYRQAGFDAVSVTQGEPQETRDSIYPLIRGTLCAAAGASGVGKSTLINTLFPFLSTETGSISQKNRRGKHTTRQSTLYDISSVIPRKEKVFFADTPGFSLLDFDRFFFMEKEDLAFSFPEFEDHLGKCRYSKCSHRTEEGCRILQAIQEGEIAFSRHESYLALWEELSKTKSWDSKKKKTRR